MRPIERSRLHSRCLFLISGSLVLSAAPTFGSESGRDQGDHYCETLLLKTTVQPATPAEALFRAWLEVLQTETHPINTAEYQWIARIADPASTAAMALSPPPDTFDSYRREALSEMSAILEQVRPATPDVDQAFFALVRQYVRRMINTEEARTEAEQISRAARSVVRPRQVRLGREDFQARNAFFNRDGSRVAVEGQYGVVVILDRNGEEVARVRGNRGGPMIARSPDGDHFVLELSSEKIGLFDFSGSRLDTIPNRGWRYGSPVQLSPDGRSLFSVDVFSIPALWDFARRKEVKFSPQRWQDSPWVPEWLRGDRLDARSASFNPDGESIAIAFEVGGRAGRVFLFNLEGRRLAELKGIRSQITQILHSPDGGLLFTLEALGPARLWNRAGKLVKEWKPFGTRLFDWGQFNPEGKTIALATRDDVTIYDLETFEERMTLRGLTEGTLSGSYSPDGTRIAIVSEYGTVRIWNTASGECLEEVLRSESPVYKAVFSADGKSILSVSRDGRASLWNVEN